MKKLSALSIAMLLCCTVFAQPTIEWQRAYGSDGIDGLSDVAYVPGDGGFIFTGSTSAANGDVTGPVKGTPDIWLVKTNSAGVIEWDTTLGGSNIDAGRAVITTADGGYLLAGQAWSSDGDIVGHKGNNDVWVAKFTGGGALSWARCYGGSGHDIPFAIANTTDGNYVISGSTQSVDGDVAGKKGGTDIWVFKISAANGNLLWQRCYGGSGTENAATIAPAADGGFVLCGSASSSNGDLTAQYGNGDMWVVKIDSVGNIMWQKNVGGSKQDRGHRAVQTLDGGFAAIGTTASNDMDIANYKDSFDIMVVKFSPTGTKEWVKAIGGKRDDQGFDIVQRSDSALIVLGITNSSDGDITTAQNDDVWVGELSPIGTILSQRSIGGSKGEIANRIHKMSDSVYVIGASTSSDDGDALGSGYHQGTGPDHWLIKVKIPMPVSVQAISAGNSDVHVFPTYTNNEVRVNFDGRPGQRTVVLMNVAGRVVYERTIDGNQPHNIQLSGLPAGMYMLHVLAGDERSSYKIIYQP